MKPLKLHTKTTIVVSLVLVAVLGVVAYFSDLAITRLNNEQQKQDAVFMATRVADVVELHIVREQRSGKAQGKGAAQHKVQPNWTDVEEAIVNTVMNRNPELSQVRVFEDSEGSAAREVIRLPMTGSGAGSLPAGDQWRVSRQSRTPEVDYVREEADKRLVGAVAPVLSEKRNPPARAGTVLVDLTFSKHEPYEQLRSLIWPLMLLAILAITLITYFLFRHIVYNPIESLLGAMSKAEAGNLSVVVDQSTSDEIGLLTARFNRMLGRIRGVTEQLADEQRQLETRVHDATAEIAERKEQLEEANLQLFEMQRQLTQLERLAAAGQLAAQFAHEVGTPLNLISGHVQLLRARATEERTIKRLDVIAGQIERITYIVRSMLDSTRRPALRLETTDINDMVIRILDASQPTLAAHNVELITNLCDDLPTVPADPDQLQQVFINLVNNSLDAMEEGGSLAVNTSRTSSGVEISVRDTGEGIPEDRIGLIFDPLFSTKPGRGTGLGLTIVKQIILEHGGTVDVESEPGHGTVFRINLPTSELSETRDQHGVSAAPDSAASRPIEEPVVEVER
ncbi:MAG TPA: ATP-binding protein [Blastocatellia bacterium]|nr:ATP-binding protein [Blastocatellia bacterium]